MGVRRGASTISLTAFLHTDLIKIVFASRTCRASLPRIHLLHAADDPTAPLRKPDCIQPQTLAAVARGSGAGSLAISGRDGPSRTHPHESSPSPSTRQKAKQDRNPFRTIFTKWARGDRVPGLNP